MTIKKVALEDVPEISPSRMKELLKRKDSDIDYSDIPPLDSDFWSSVEVPVEDTKVGIYIRLDAQALAWFKRKPKYQTLINNLVVQYYKKYGTGDNDKNSSTDQS